MPWVKSNLGSIALAIALQTQTALAQGDLLGADEMAEAIVSMSSPVWTGSDYLAVWAQDTGSNPGTATP